MKLGKEPHTLGLIGFGTLSEFELDIVDLGLWLIRLAGPVAGIGQVDEIELLSDSSDPLRLL